MNNNFNHRDTEKDGSNFAVAVVRFAVFALGAGFQIYLTQQLLAGKITFGSEYPDENIVVTTPGALIVAYLTWTPFFLGLMLAGIKPGLYVKYRWLFPVLFCLIFIFYALFNIFCL